VVATEIPIGTEHEIRGVVDLVDMKAYEYDGDGRDNAREIPEVDEVHLVTNSRFAAEFRRWAGPTGVLVHDDGTSTNDDRLGAIGDLQLAIERGAIDDDLLVIAGDNLFDYRLADFVADWRRRGTSGAVAVYDCGDLELATHYGVVEVGEDDRVVSFEEKPSEPRSTLVATATSRNTTRSTTVRQIAAWMGANASLSGSSTNTRHPGGLTLSNALSTSVPWGSRPLVTTPWPVAALASAACTCGNVAR